LKSRVHSIEYIEYHARLIFICLYKKVGGEEYLKYTWIYSSQTCLVLLNFNSYYVFDSSKSILDAFFKSTETRRFKNLFM